MAKANEIASIEEVVRINRVPLSEFQTYLLNQPFSDPRCHEYLTDVAQIMSLLPPAPAKLLDVAGIPLEWVLDFDAADITPAVDAAYLHGADLTMPQKS